MRWNSQPKRPRARRSYCLEVLEGYNEYTKTNDDALVWGCYDVSMAQSEPLGNLSNQTIGLNDLLKNVSIKREQKKPRRHGKSEKLNPSESYETPASTALKKRSKNFVEQDTDAKDSCGIHNRSSKFRKFVVELKDRHGRLQVSRLGRSLRGSIKVMCTQFKVAYILIWAVDTTCYDIKLLPVVNCSSLSINDLNFVSKIYCKELIERFEIDMNLLSFSAMDIEEKFCVLSNHITESETVEDLTNLLLLYFKKPRDMLNPMRNTLRQFNVDMKKSLDYFDIVSMSSFDDERDLSSNVSEESEVYDEDICPICFDQYEDNDVQLMTCGHKACRSCWQGLIRSSSLSGDTKILCPAYKCQERLTLSDTAHLLFENCETVCEKDTRAFMKLTEFKIDDMLLDKNLTHCSTPSCSRLMKKPTSNLKKLSKEVKCHSMCLCDCGAMTCEECGQPAHFGISCQAAKRLRKEIACGNINSELKSLLWMHKNTTPCPRCRFPINKNGGCNHVRCSNCSYYFCWLCGGDGTKCGAFFCQNTNTRNYHDNSASSNYDQQNLAIKNQMSLIKSFYNCVQDVEAMSKRNPDGFQANDRKLLLEFKLRSLLMWMNGIALDKSLSGINLNSGSNQLLDEIKVLEMIIKTLGDNCSKIDSIISAHESYTKPCQHSKKRSKKSKKSNGANDEIALDIILQAMRLRAMNKNQFNNYANIEFLKMMRDLVNIGKEKSSNNCFDDNNSVTITNSPKNSLNKKEKILNVPWKGERRFQDNNDSRGKKEGRIPWKGKVKITTRRNLMLAD